MPLGPLGRQEGRHYRSSVARRRRLILSRGAAALLIPATLMFPPIRSEPLSWSNSPAAPPSLAAPLAPITLVAPPVPAAPITLAAPTAPATPSALADLADLATPSALPSLAPKPLGKATAAIPVGLQDSIDRILRGAKGYRVGVALAAVSGGESHTYGDQSPFVAASTAKLITAAAYYHLVETGEASLEQRLGYSNAGFQLEAMIRNSNNDSWHLLRSAVGYPRLIRYAASIGIPYDQQNLLTPAEMALFLTQLYSGGLLNREHTEQLLGYMQNTNFESLIPAACRPDITVHHKYGLLNGNLHDAALLSLGETTYALVIYTEIANSKDQARRIQMIHTLTETIVDAVFPLSQPSG